MNLSQSHPLNQQPIRYLKSLEQSGEPAIAGPDSHPDPYWKLGARPDEVMALWEHIGQELPTDCRAIVYKIPALVHPTSGVILAFVAGTNVISRVPEHLIEAAIAAGAQVETNHSNGTATNLEQEMGRGWFFGCTLEWTLEMYNGLEDST